MSDKRQQNLSVRTRRTIYIFMIILRYPFFGVFKFSIKKNKFKSIKFKILNKHAPFTIFLN